MNEFGCDASIRGCNGKFLLQCACEGGKIGIVQALLKNNTDCGVVECFVNAYYYKPEVNFEELAVTIINKYRDGSLLYVASNKKRSSSGELTGRGSYNKSFGTSLDQSQNWLYPVM